MFHFHGPPPPLLSPYFSCCSSALIHRHSPLPISIHETIKLVARHQSPSPSSRLQPTLLSLSHVTPLQDGCRVGGHAFPGFLPATRGSSRAMMVKMAMVPQTIFLSPMSFTAALPCQTLVSPYPMFEIYLGTPHPRLLLQMLLVMVVILH